MCGILGTFDVNRDVAGHVDSLRHRGPDTARVASGDGYRFGHTLLSIIGEAPVTQPITSTDGRVTLTYNGEIYNYVELLAGDVALRDRCSVPSDTQVLVEGLALYGIEFVEKLNGIFAFAAFEHATGTGYLVRDRIGVKPLYWARVNGGVAFASEMRPLVEMGGVSREPDVEAFYSYARFRYPIGERSYFRAIRTLPAGTILRWRDGAATTTKYWDIEEPAPFTGTYEDARAHAAELLADSIRIQMRSDHSFCTYLSGGLDSSYLTAVARANKDRLDTYSIGIDGGIDESPYALQVAEHLGTDHHPYRLTADEYRAQHEAFVRHLGTPVSVPNQVALKVLSRELSRDHRCVLSGEGADEVFGGYGRIFLLPVDWDGESDYPALFLRRYGYLTHSETVHVLAAKFPAQAVENARDAVEGEIRELFGRWSGDLFTRQLLLFQKIHLPGLLMRVDTATMAHGVEGRVPFLDHRLVEFLNSLPIHFKMKRKDTFDAAVASGLTSDQLSEVHDVPKAPLKEIAESVLPREIVWRKKVGFPIPQEYYGGGEEPAYVAWVKRNLELIQ